MGGRDTIAVKRLTVYIVGVTMGLIGFPPYGAWLVCGNQAPAGLAEFVQDSFVWMTAPLYPG